MIKLLQAALNVRSHPAAVLEPVLEIADSVMTYRRQYFAAPHLLGVFTLLLRDDSNPRSLAFQVRQLAAHIADLVTDADASTPGIEQNRINALLANISSEDFHTLLSSADMESMSGRLGAWVNELAALSDDISSRYFSHSVPRIS